MNCVHGNEHLARSGDKNRNRKIHNEICAYIYLIVVALAVLCGHNTAPDTAGKRSGSGRSVALLDIDGSDFSGNKLSLCHGHQRASGFFPGIGSASKKGILFKSGFAVEGD